MGHLYILSDLLLERFHDERGTVQETAPGLPAMGWEAAFSNRLLHTQTLNQDPLGLHLHGQV